MHSKNEDGGNRPPANDESGRSLFGGRGEKSMLRHRGLSDSTEATAQSALIWSIAAILLIVAAVPAALYAAQGIQELSQDESYLHLEQVSDFNNLDGFLMKGQVDEPVYYNNPDAYIGYDYENSSAALSGTYSLYTSNETGNDYNEVLFKNSGDTFSKFEGFVVGLNQSTQDAIDNDLSEVKFTAEFPREANITIELWSATYDSDDNGHTYKIGSKDFSAGNTSTNMTEYSFDVDYSKILEADSETDYDGNQLSIKITGDDNALKPADSLKFNIDLIHSTSAVSTFWTMNIVAGITGIVLIPCAIFATPWVDLKDLTGA